MLVFAGFFDECNDFSRLKLYDVIVERIFSTRLIFNVIQKNSLRSGNNLAIITQCVFDGKDICVSFKSTLGSTFKRIKSYICFICKSYMFFVDIETARRECAIWNGK